MGQGTSVLYELLAQPLTEEEIREREEAEKPRRKLVATLNGQLVEKATPREVSRVVVIAPKQTWD